jgi:hypothetical protein
MPELAYIDPGSGSLIIQAAIAAVVAIPVFFRNQIGRLLAGLRGREATNAPSRSPDDHVRSR